MPKKEVLNGHARKLVYDVNCFIKKETNEIVGNLKLIKNSRATTILNLQENLGKTIQSLHLIIKRLTTDVDKLLLTEICSHIEHTQKEYLKASQESENKLQLIINNLKQCQKRTALATNISASTVKRITSQANNPEFMAFKTPGKKKPRAKPVTEIDIFNQGVIKRCIHNFHITNKEFPTIEKLRIKLQEDINYQGSQTSLRQIFKNLGFQWKKTENNRKVLIETSNIRLNRIEYLKQIKKYRQEGRPIIYIAESYIDSSHSNVKGVTDGSSKALKKTISKGQRVVILHAGSEVGFVPNALLTFIAGSKTGDYHNMNFKNYVKWLKTQLIPNIPPKSVLIIDNSANHNKQYDRTLSPNSKKADMQGWLSEKGIKFDNTLLKPQLYQLIKENKEKYKENTIDNILAEHHHNVLRLPPYHPDLNPIELAWSMIKQYVASKNIKWDVKCAIDLVKEKANLMGAREWEMLCNKVKAIEEEYAKNDIIIDSMTEELVFSLNDDSSDSDESQDDEDSEMSDDDEVPCVKASCSQPQPCASDSNDDFRDVTIKQEIVTPQNMDTSNEGDIKIKLEETSDNENESYNVYDQMIEIEIETQTQ